MDKPSNASIDQVFAARKARQAEAAAQAESEEPSEQVQPTEEEAEVEDYEPEAPAVEGDEAQAETEESAETEAEGQPEPEFYDVTVNGETQRVTLEDLRKGYMMQSDYTRKTSEVAEGRRALEAERESFNDKVSIAEDVVRLELEDLESAAAMELKDLDPQEYYSRKERVEAKQKRLEELKSERDRNRVESRNRTIAAEQQRTAEAIPEWLDQEVLQKEIPLMQQMWTSMGLSDDDLQSDQFLDHRFIVISRKAALYDELMRAKPEAKKVKQAPKSAEPGAASQPESSSGQKRLEAAQAKLKKTGSIRDAQEVARIRRQLRQ